jgi:16S rRNA (cytosine1402-N4)-methyltransferase
VLAAEVIELLQPQPGQTIVDGTLGGGGHTRLLADRVGSEGTVIALDRDPAAIARAETSLAGLPVQVAVSNYCDLEEVLRQLQISHVDGILLDLGLSSDQLADDDRGFSFDAEGPLDLRFNPEDGRPAWQLVEHLGQRELADLIYRFGEERLSRRIARTVVAERRQRPIRTAAELARLVRRCYPPAKRRRERIDPATRTFQALRMAVNDELTSLTTALRRFPDCLHPAARVAVISFHSLEDRIVKTIFRDDQRYDIVTRKPVRPGPVEVAANPRSRSARLRVAARTPEPDSSGTIPA